MSIKVIAQVLALNDEDADRPKAERIGPVGQCVLLVLANYCNDEGVTIIGLSRLAREACCDRRTAVRTLQRLAKLKRISRTYTHDAHGLVEGAITTLIPSGAAPPRGGVPPSGNDDAPRGQPVLPLGAERPPNLKPTVRQPKSPSDSSSKARKRAERIPIGWKPSDEGRAFARSLGLSDAQIDFEAAQMADWSQSSPNGAKRDDAAFWRNWVRKAATRLGRTPASKSKPDHLRDAMRRYAQSEEEPHDQSGTDEAAGDRFRGLLPPGRR